MELAPILGMADRIVDNVDTGRTLKENGLEPTELIMPVSARLVVNKASMKMKHAAVDRLVARLREACAAGAAA
jgi:ATP phosphoribosyltransferase